jgi:hypothetical protein
MVGCQNRTPAPAVGEPTATPTASAPTDTVLQLERTVCFGFCPTYIATVTASGTTYIAGTRTNEAFRREITVDPAEVAALLAEFDAEGYFQLDSAYTPGHPLCGLQATDHPGANLFAKLGSKAKRVEHYHGCHGARGASPDEPRPAPLQLLTKLEDAVDSLVNIAAMVDSLKRGR